MIDHKDFDVIIIGGSYAGLSAAMALGRSLRSVLVINSGKPCNRFTPHSHNFLTQDGETPAAIAEKAKQQILYYDTVQLLDDLAVSGQQTGTGFEIATQSHGVFRARKLIFATGIRDIFPDIKGFSECWGVSVIHCPYCHGYEYRGKKTGIMAHGEAAFHIASLVHNLTDQITILTEGKTDFDTEQIAKLRKHAIEIVEKEIQTIEHTNGHVQQVLFTDGTQIDFDALYAAIPFEQHSNIPISLGCELTESGHIKVDIAQRTNIKGVFACGDNSNKMRSVASAVASGNMAGSMVNHEMTEL